uniref:uncharacterized protein LOC100185002 n=1 Tax=Ciona intestinalis TaxID=7719 RepID=UPI0005211FD0|nr:uncharacterized protein LOC100185002 [Ciona intestinalis]|eukprot:XP_009857581.1 uncharacterized protein LOC100185002 [Ciona intestinalis]
MDGTNVKCSCGNQFSGDFCQNELRQWIGEVVVTILVLLLLFAVIALIWIIFKKRNKCLKSTGATTKSEPKPSTSKNIDAPKPPPGFPVYVNTSFQGGDDHVYEQ